MSSSTGKNDSWRPGSNGMHITLRKDFDARHVRKNNIDGTVELSSTNPRPEQVRDDLRSSRGCAHVPVMPSMASSARSASASRPTTQDLPRLNLQRQQSSNASYSATSSTFSPKSPFEGAATSKSVDPRRRHTTTVETAQSPSNPPNQDAPHKDVASIFKEAMIAVATRRHHKDRVVALERKVAQLRHDITKSSAHYPHKTYLEQLQTNLAKHEKDLATTKRDFEDSHAREKHYLGEITRLVTSKSLTTIAAEDPTCRSSDSISQRLKQLEESNLILQAKLQQQGQSQNTGYAAWEEKMKVLEAHSMERERKFHERLDLLEKEHGGPPDGTGNFEQKWNDLNTRVGRVHQSLEQDIRKQAGLTADLQTQHHELLKKFPHGDSVLLEQSDLHAYVEKFNEHKIDMTQRFNDMEQKIAGSTFLAQLSDLNARLSKESSARENMERQQETMVTQQSQLKVLDTELNPLRANISLMTRQITELSAKTASFTDDDRNRMNDTLSLRNQIHITSTELAKVQQDTKKNEHAITGLKAVYDNLSTEKLHKDIVATVIPYISTVKTHLDKHDKEIVVLRADSTSRVQQTRADLQQLLRDDMDTVRENIKKLLDDLQVLQSAHEKLDEIANATSESCRAHGRQSEQITGIIQDVTQVQQQLSERQAEIVLLQANDRTLPHQVQQIRDEFSESTRNVVAGVTQAKDTIDKRLTLLEERMVVNQTQQPPNDVTMGNTRSGDGGAKIQEVDDNDNSDISGRARTLPSDKPRKAAKHGDRRTKPDLPVTSKHRSEQAIARKNKKRVRDEIKEVIDEDDTIVVDLQAISVRPSHRGPAVDLTEDDDHQDLSTLLQKFTGKPGASTAATLKGVLPSHSNGPSKRKSDAESRSHRKHSRKA